MPIINPMMVVITNERPREDFCAWYKAKFDTPMLTIRHRGFLIPCIRCRMAVISDERHMMTV